MCQDENKKKKTAEWMNLSCKTLKTKLIKSAEAIWLTADQVPSVGKQSTLKEICLHRVHFLNF